MKRLSLVFAAAIAFMACGDNSGNESGMGGSIDSATTSPGDNSTIQADTAAMDTNQMNGSGGTGAGGSTGTDATGGSGSGGATGSGGTSGGATGSGSATGSGGAAGAGGATDNTQSR